MITLPFSNVGEEEHTQCFEFIGIIKYQKLFVEKLIQSKPSTNKALVSLWIDDTDGNSLTDKTVKPNVWF